MEPYVFIYKNEEYIVEFVQTMKLTRSIRFEVQNNHIVVYASAFHTRKQLIQVVEKHKLAITNMYKRKMNKSNDYIYIFGEKKEITYDNNYYTINGAGCYKTNEELNRILKRLLNRYIDVRFPFFVDLMHVEKNKYTYHIQNTSTRYGSNSSRTNRILFSLDLVHFSFEIIDSVIVHELAHDFQRNHSDKFYEIVYRYCPNYNDLRNKMVKGMFK